MNAEWAAYVARMGAEQLGALWPEVCERVGRVLRGRGVDADRVGDVLQEVAVRALRSDPPVDSVDRLAAWSYVVATRVLVDQARTRGTLALVDDPVSAARHDPSRVVEGRLELERMMRAMARLSPADRAVLLATLDEATGPAADRHEIVRNAVRRHRARARLTAAMDRLAAAVGTVVLRLRRPWGRAVAVGGSALVVALGLFPGAPRDPARAALPPAPTVVPAPPVPATTSTTVRSALRPAAGAAPTVKAPPPPTPPDDGDEEPPTTTTTLPGGTSHGGIPRPQMKLLDTALAMLPGPKP